MRADITVSLRMTDCTAFLKGQQARQAIDDIKSKASARGIGVSEWYDHRTREIVIDLTGQPNDLATLTQASETPALPAPIA